MNIKPKSLARPLTEADLDYSIAAAAAAHAAAAARRPVQCPPCHGQCHQGRMCTARQACAPESAGQQAPYHAGQRRQSALLGLLLVLLCWVPPLLVVAFVLRACN